MNNEQSRTTESKPTIPEIDIEEDIEMFLESEADFLQSKFTELGLQRRDVHPRFVLRRSNAAYFQPGDFSKPTIKVIDPIESYVRRVIIRESDKKLATEEKAPNITSFQPTSPRLPVVRRLDLPYVPQVRNHQRGSTPPLTSRAQLPAPLGGHSAGASCRWNASSPSRSAMDQEAQPEKRHRVGLCHRSARKLRSHPQLASDFKVPTQRRPRASVH